MQFVPIKRAPRKTPMIVSGLAHLALAALLLWLVALARSRPVLIAPPIAGNVQPVRVQAVTLPPAKGAQLALAQKKPRHAARKPQPPGAGDKEGVAAIRAEARRETLALVQNFKFRTTYGFSPFPRYELPLQISGALPVISPDELPPRYEQYLIVEITIDSKGEVVDARLTAGQADPKVTNKVLAAVRQFKYRPATREGAPIPSQTDLVVHIPT
jgi:TonB family protein